MGSQGVGIIGLGRLGSALARGLGSATAVQEILGLNRTRAKADAVAALVPELRLCGSEAEVLSRAGIVFPWTKPEDAAEVVERVAHPGGPSEAGVAQLRATLPALLEQMLRGRHLT
jgi:pyrroline-5-carboxylate reductase